MPEAASNKQYIVVTNTLNFNLSYAYVFAPGSVIVLSENAQFTVNSDLTLKGVEIKGCSSNTTWPGILVSSTGALRMIENCKVSEACAGVLLSHGAKAEITNTTFQHNFSCVKASGSVQLTGEGISHNTFDGVDVLTGCSGIRHAINVENTPYFKIGNDISGGQSNDFIGFGTPIRVIDSNVDIYNSSFFNTNPTLSGVAINLIGTSGTYTANIIGLGSGSSNMTFAQGYEFGIQSNNYNLTVKNAFFDHNIYHIRAGGTLPVYVNITKNRFERMASIGVQIVGVPFLSAVIDTNQISDNLGDTDFAVRTGISWSGNTAAGGEPANIRSNVIRDNDKPIMQGFSGYTHRGLFVGGSSGVHIEENWLTQSYSALFNPHKYNGIVLSNSNGNQIIGNRVSSVDRRPAYEGIRFEMSAENLISCNAVSNLGKGFAFWDECDHSNFRFNEMEDNFSGLALEVGDQVATKIGRQFKQGNVWRGDLPQNGVAEAVVEGGANPATVQNSLFYISNANPTSNLWANPRIPSSSWFLPAPEETLFSNCITTLSPDDRVSAAERSTIGGTFGNYTPYPALTWDATLQTYGTLDQNLDLRPVMSAEDTFYQQHQNANIGKLSRAMRDWEGIRKMTAGFKASWESNHAQIDQKLADIRVQQGQMPSAGQAQQAQIAQNIAALQSDVTELQQANQSLSTQYQSGIATRCNLLLGNLSAITTTDIWEQNLKTVLTLSTDRLLAGNGDWTIPQYSTLQSIADQCRYEGGKAVVLARVAIEKSDYNDEILCQPVERTTITTNKPSALLAPNPATDWCEINFGRSFNGMLTVFSLQGQRIFSRALIEASSLSLDTHTWPPGMYEVDIRSDQSDRIVQKLAIIR